MKVIIEKIPLGSGPEIIVRSNELEESLMKLIYFIQSPSKKLIGVSDLLCKGRSLCNDVY